MLIRPLRRIAHLKQKNRPICKETLTLYKNAQKLDVSSQSRRNFSDILIQFFRHLERIFKSLIDATSIFKDGNGGKTGKDRFEWNSAFILSGVPRVPPLLQYYPSYRSYPFFNQLTIWNDKVGSICLRK